MKYDHYISLIQSLEVEARENRTWYGIKVLLLTILGYAYFVGLIVLFLLPFVFLGLLLFAGLDVFFNVLLNLAKLWWVFVAALPVYFGFLGSAIKAITAKVPDPVGTELERSDAPELFDFVAATCRELKAQQPMKILVDDSFNAGVVTMPRFGIFGRKVFMLLGLPLLKSLAPDQLKAVIAHEIGHISGRHGVFAKWAYQMREAWGRLIDSQELLEHKFSTLYSKFVDWFFPYFTAYSFVLMREHEKDADRDAAALVGARPLGEALITLEMTSRSSEEFWQSVHKENLVSKKPPENMFTRMLSELQFTDEARVAKSLAEAVAVPTDFNDSHPSLGERLRLIGYWTEGDLPPTPVRSKTDAAEAFLSAEITGRLNAGFDASWDSQTRESWEARHDHFQESDKRLAELEAKRADGTPSHEELREMAVLLTNRDGIEAAIPIIEEAASKFPDDAVAWYNLGMARLSQNDDVGIEYLDKSSSMDTTLKYDAGTTSFNYLRSKGRLDEARRYAALLDEQSEVYEKARIERSGISASDRWLEHDLPQDLIDSIPRKLAGLDEIVAIYVANKKVEFLPEMPFRVVFIELRGKQRGDAAANDILQIVSNRMTDERIHYVAVLNHLSGDVAGQLGSLPNARIYTSHTG
jgi:Zn-dependent protease with chaperone function